MVVLAVVFLIVGQALRGTGWAVGVSMAVASAVTLFVVYAISFGLLWLIALIPAVRNNTRPPYYGTPLNVRPAIPAASQADGQPRDNSDLVQPFEGAV